jgi:hypothetical protein
LLSLQGVLVEEEGSTNTADNGGDSDKARVLWQLLIRFHGILAPNAKLRAQVVPQQPEPPAQAAARSALLRRSGPAPSGRSPWAMAISRSREALINPVDCDDLPE